jgi:squalene-hopene/tetraprenyl-beta-curcumene cyclase
VLELIGPDPLVSAETVARGLACPERSQEADGSWFGRWGANCIYGTGAAVPALRACGVQPSDVRVVRGLQWLRERQNSDGGWGEDLRSYRKREWRGKGDSTPSQTAWALLAFHSAGERSETTERGIDYLATIQQADGTWPEPQFTGTGFPGDFYINYHLYRQVFPLMALGRFATREGSCHPIEAAREE